jgi:hypothetical protein
MSLSLRYEQFTHNELLYLFLASGFFLHNTLNTPARFTNLA